MLSIGSQKPADLTGVCRWPAGTQAAWSQGALCGHEPKQKIKCMGGDSGHYSKRRGTYRRRERELKVGR